MRVYAYILVYKHICLCTYAYILYPPAYLPAYLHACMHTYIGTVYMYVCTHVCTYVCTSVCMNVCMSYTCVYTYVCIYVCMCVCHIVKIAHLQSPRDFANNLLVQDTLCCAERKAPLNFRVYFVLQLSELA